MQSVFFVSNVNNGKKRLEANAKSKNVKNISELKLEFNIINPFEYGINAKIKMKGTKVIVKNKIYKMLEGV